MKREKIDQTNSGNISLGDVLFIFAIISIILWTLGSVFIRGVLFVTGLISLGKMFEKAANKLQEKYYKLAVVAQKAQQ